MNKRAILPALAIALMLTIPSVFAGFSTQGLAPPGYQTYSTATIGQPRTLDGSWAYDTASAGVIFNVYETLIEQDKGSVTDFIPELATSWTISPDGETYTFQIRTGVTFSNGNPFTPSDVEYSLERTMVRDRSGGPNWMFYVPIIGTFGSRYFPGVNSADIPTRNAARAALGALIDAAIESDNVAGTVTIKLVQPEGFFMQILSQSWGSIMDQEWMSRTVTFPGGAVDSFDWTGSWGTNGYEWWIFNNYNREVDATYFATRISPTDNPPQMMGTGPFTFTAWVKGEGGYRQLDRNTGYWGGWPAGALGTARANKFPIPSRGQIDTFIEYQKQDWTVRKLGLLSGTYDSVYVPRSNIGEVWQQANIRNRYPIIGLAADALFFGFNIADGMTGMSPYVGTEAWGTGLPLTAFSDINLRKAFQYSFNQTKFLAEQFLYEAFQAATPIIPGLAPFTDPEIISYAIANRKNIDLVKAEYYFKLAWGGTDIRSGTPGVPVLPEDPTKVNPVGAVWTNGFTFDMVYNIGNDPRKLSGDMLAAQLLTINNKFLMGNVGIDWPDFLDAMYNGPTNDISIMPVWAIGWQADYADADNWMTPFFYTAGDFSFTQAIPDFGQDAVIDAARAASDISVRKTLYNQAQDLWVQNVPSIMGMVALGRRWERDWVQGWYNNPVFPATNLYTLWKEVLPWEDVDANGKVEIKDLSVAAKAYGSYFVARMPPMYPPTPSTPGYPNPPWGTYTTTWDSRPDVNQDMKVDIKDLAKMAKLFGFQAPGWP